MPNVRINHMELTFGEGELTAGKKAQISEFYRELFGWNSMEVDIVDQKALLLMLDDEVSQFILCAESPNPIQSPGYDHLGLLFDGRDEVDNLLAKCKQKREENSQIEIKEYKDLREGAATVHAFYVRHLLPIWFDVQSIDYAAGSEPAKRWTYA